MRKTYAYYLPHTEVGTLLWLVSLVAIAICQNIDTDRPILREVNDIADGSLFGYSLVLHQTHSSPSNMEEAISGVK